MTSRIGMLAVLALGLAGCGVPPMAVMSQAEATHRATAELRNAAGEWAVNVQSGDDALEARAIAAFVTRVRRAGDDEGQLAKDTAAFTAALGNLRADRFVADERLRIVLDNLDAMDEAADQMHLLAVESQSLSDEWRRYVADNFAAYKASQKDAAERHAAERAARQQKRAAIVQSLLGQLPAATGLPANILDPLLQATQPATK